MRRYLAVVMGVLLGCSGKVEPSAASDAGGGGQSNPLSGTYKGYIQSFMFPDGSDTVVMTLTFANDGAVTGTVLFGDRAPYAAPTNPNVAFPPGYTGQALASSLPLEGFDFTVLEGVYAAPRLKLQIQHTEVWKQWCEIQTSYPFCNCAGAASDGGSSDGDCGGNGCLPNAATMLGGTSCAYEPCGASSFISIDCGKLQLCGWGGPCACTDTGCTVPVGPTGDISFDMQLMAGSLNGSTSGLEGTQVLNVVLTKEP